MVLCRYFLRGNCHYGSKCRNVHIDVKQIVKADVEASINGKQWPFSCYGLFKDKACIPNFVEDQSFEEIRMMCYEAKQKNYFEQFHQQFNKEVIEATNKMKALLQFTPDFMETIINIYNAPNNTTDVKNNNPFCLVKSDAMASNSIFAKSTNLNMTNTPFNSRVGGSGEGIFGGSNKSQLANNSMFGGATPSQFQQQTQQSIFGQTNTFTNPIFGGANNSGSMFSQAQNMANGGNIFAQQMNQPQTGGNFGLFSEAAMAIQPQAQPQQQQVQPQPQLQQPSSIFTLNTQQPTNLFTNAFQSANNVPQQLAVNPNIFNSATAATQQQNLFTQTSQPTTNIFAQALQQQEESKMLVNNPAGNQEQFAEEMLVTATPSNTTGSTTVTFNSYVYSNMNDLTADEIEAFKAERFQPGKIPLNPPPKELIS